jgi:ribonucleoside-diphosphate reductase alpha chain
VKYKNLAGRGMLKIVNNTVPLALKTLGYDQPKIESILGYIEEHDTIEGAPDLQVDHLGVFDCAFKPQKGTRSIPWRAHVTMMAAAQPFLSGAISKTVNMPRESTPADIAGAYMEGWRLGLKALAIYRDGSKGSQPVGTSMEGDKTAAKVTAAPRRERLLDTRDSVTHKFSVAGHEGYLTVGLYEKVDKDNPNENRRPGELFINMAKEGSTIGGVMDAFGTAISMSLQYGVPLEVLVNKFSHMRFEPMGHTKNPDIRIAKSIIDYIFRWLGNEFLRGYKEANKGYAAEEAASSPKGAEPAVPKAVATGKTTESPSGAAVATTASTAKPAAAKPPVAKSAANGVHSTTNGHGKSSVVADNAAMLHRAGAAMYIDQNAGVVAREEQFASFQLDAPACDNCGAITVRNGNCYLCHNCGNSMGCS